MGAGINLFRQLFPEDYYAYQTATLISSKPVSKKVGGIGVNKFDKTDFVDNKIYGDGVESSAVGFAHSDFIPCLPNTSYYTNASAIGAFYTVDFFDKGKNYISDNRSDLPSAGPGVFTTPANCYYMIVNTNKSQCSIDALCVNYPSSDTSYHAYEEHTYPLGSDEIRGVFKIENGELVAYGDVHNSDGTGTRYFDADTVNQYDILDTSGYGYTNIVYAIFSKPATSKDKGKATANLICKYPTNNAVTNWDSADKVGYIFGGADYNKYWVGFPYGTSLADMKAALADMPFIYELATPESTTYTAFSNPMICGSTEEFTDSRSVQMPVGHDSYYEKDLIVPNTPTADGTYTLKCVVSHGEPTLNWQADT